MNRLCPTAGCLRQRVPDWGFCEQHTREYLRNAFAPEWVRRAQRHQLPVRIEGGKAA